MRTIRYSQTFREELRDLLAQGLPMFGPHVVAEKRRLVLDTVKNFLVHFPIRTPDPVLGLCACTVSKTPFVIVYDYDDAELRVHLIIHSHADRSQIDLSTVVW